MRQACAFALIACATAGARAGDVATAAQRIAEAAGVQGGFVVHIGCGGGDLTAELRLDGRFVVQGVDTAPGSVELARARLQREGLYGTVSAVAFDGKRLPYIDNLVNLLVVGQPCAVERTEILRVLAPGGSAIDPRGSVILRKPWPEEIDEWTHFLHGPDNNAVAQDTRIGSPRHHQWVGGPKWSRHHDRMASLSAAVSAAGRLFYIMDEGPTGSALALPDWRLTARDAFNGTTLWSLSLPEWYPHLWPLKSGPAWLPRRLVASGDHVYVTLGLHAPVTRIDAATGRTVRTYEGSNGAGEILFDNGLLLVTVDESPKRVAYEPRVGIGMATVSMERDMVAKDYPWDWSPKRVMAIRAETGTTLWQKMSPVAPLTLSMNAKSVFFHDGDQIVCLSRASGEERWRTTPTSSLQGSPRNWYPKTIKNTGKLGKALPASYAPNLVLHGGVVLFSGGDGKLCGLDQKTGKQLWTGECLSSGHYTPEDVLVANGLVWTAEIAHGNSSGKAIGLDPMTGEVRRTIRCDARIPWFHQRCYRSKATERYLLTSRNGIEFVDLETGRWTPNHWVRGGCLYGILPCNGLIYTPPHSCACYLEAKLFGFNALAARRDPVDHEPPARLQKGPAYRERPSSSGEMASRESWPTFRHDNRRSGCASTAIEPPLQEKWRVRFPTRATQPTIADGRAIVAVPDQHAVVCLSAATGEEIWRFTADGRVDSPPTIFDGLCAFGSADGHVYCLTMDTGELSWRFRAAARDQGIIAFDQVESVTPVSGSVLVRGDEVVFAAGRSVFLDGGLRMIRLDGRTGRLLSERVMDDKDPEQPDRGFQYRARGLNMPVGLPDILSCDGRNIYMRSQQFDLEGKRRNLKAVPSVPNAAGGDRHIFSPTGFLDASWMHRSYWVYGTGFDEGAGGWSKAGKVVPAGRVLCHDSESVYGYGRRSRYFQWSTPLEYHLFAARKGSAARKKGKSGTRVTYRWSRLYIAGPPAVIHEADAYRDPLNERVKAMMKEQTDAFRGKRGGMLKVVAAASGDDVVELRLDYLPAFDGMAAAEGRLFVVSEDGRLVCYGGGR
ncbi:MAG: outer membrane protein assembly factor BamB family protein [Planctomycetota bacterium]|jgi:outer membrane protein assembly factor BamB